MPTYISLLNFTDQGIRTVNETIQRVDSATERAQQFGVSFQSSYWTVGPYDLVITLEAPDDQSLPPFSWMPPPGEPSGRLRFVPMTAKRCRASLGSLAELS
jgi:uncharacterized protein with GYD domain